MKIRFHKTVSVTLIIATLLITIGYIYIQNVDKNAYICDYPEMIKKRRLERLYDKAVIDWYIINTSWWGSGDYLIIYDQIADSVLIHYDTLSGYMTLDKSLTKSYEKMKSVLPENVYRYEEIHLEIPDFVEGLRFYGDTILLTLLPEVNNNEYILDLTGGYVYNLYYLEEELVRIGANDYVEMDINPESFPRDSLWSLCKSRFEKEKSTFSDWWNCQFLKVIE